MNDTLKLTVNDLANLSTEDFHAYFKAAAARGASLPKPPVEDSTPAPDVNAPYLLIEDVKPYKAGTKLAFVRQFPKARTRAFFQVEGTDKVEYIRWESVLPADQVETLETTEVSEDSEVEPAPSSKAA